MEQELTLLCQKTFGGDHTIQELRRLTGGANAATWSFDYGLKPLVLRQDSSGADETQERSGISAIGLKTEAALMSKAAEYNIKAPKIYAVTPKESAFGEAVLMERVSGEALPQKLFKDPKYETALSGLTIECAQALAKIHTIPSSEFEKLLDTRTPEKALSMIKEQFADYGQSSAVLASAINWMGENCPKDSESVLLHADFRMGNLLIDETGITSVLDWELSHIGDPVSDVAYFCAPPWRFGRYDKQAGGVGSLDSLVTAYEAASGRIVESDRILWWRMHSSVNWCLMCMTMANMWRTHADRELERIVIGTRVSESEVDILLLFDEIYAFEDTFNPELSIDDPKDHKAHTKPTELTDAIIEWLSDDIIPDAKGREGFKARVARNAMGILKRDITLSPHFKPRQSARLEQLETNEDDLIVRLLKGSISIQDNDIRRHLKRTTLEQLSIDQPKYTGFKVALTNWSHS